MPLNGEPGQPPESPCDSFQLLEQHLGIESGRIAKLRGQCEIFSEICADYAECCARFHILEQECKATDERARQYAEMRDLLKQDITSCLAGVPPCRCRQIQSRKTPESSRSPS